VKPDGHPVQYKVFYTNNWGMHTKQIKHAVKRDKEAFLNQQCEQLEADAKRGNSRGSFQTVKNITSRFQPRLLTIKDKQGNTLSEQDMVVNRWKEYCTELYSETPSATQQPIRDFHVSDKEPPPLKSEISTTIKKLSNRKSPGADGILAELYIHGGPVMIDVIHQLCLEVWKTGEWPVAWTKSIFIPLPKKGDLSAKEGRSVSLQQIQDYIIGITCK